MKHGLTSLNSSRTLIARNLYCWPPSALSVSSVPWRHAIFLKIWPNQTMKKSPRPSARPWRRLNAKQRKKLHGTVEKVIRSSHSPEQAKVAMHEPEHLYREIRVENQLMDGGGTKARLKQGAEVDVIVEAGTMLR